MVPFHIHRRSQRYDRVYWHNESDTEIINLYTDDKGIAVTYDFGDVEDFIDDIKELLCEKYSVSTINYLFYDNYELDQEIKGKL